MQITVDVPEEFVAEVTSRGLTPEIYVQNLVAERTAILRSTRPGQEQTLQEFDAFLDALALNSEKIPLLPIEAFSRESIYQDHD